MFCPKCGAQLIEGADFCTTCGAPVGKRSQADAQAQTARAQAARSTPQLASMPATPTVPSPPASSTPHVAPGVMLKKKRRKGPIIAVAALLAVAAIAVGLIFGLGLFNSSDGSVYVVTRVTSYNDNGSVVRTESYELDEHGNAVHMEYAYSGSNGASYEIDSEFDKYGYVTRCVQTVDGVSYAVEYNRELDSENRVVKEESETTTMKCSYHQNGVMKKRTVWAMATMNSQMVTEYEYDDKGYPVSIVVTRVDGETRRQLSSTTFEWEFDRNGNPKSFTATAEASDAGGKAPDPITCDCECDEHGNIVRVTSNGAPLLEYEYKEIANPSLSARINAALFIMN